MDDDLDTQFMIHTGSTMRDCLDRLMKIYSENASVSYSNTDFEVSVRQAHDIAPTLNRFIKWCMETQWRMEADTVDKVMRVMELKAFL